VTETGPGPRVADTGGQGQWGKVLWSRQLRKPDRSTHRKANTLHVLERGCLLGDASGVVADSFRWGEVVEFTKQIVEQHVNYKYKSTDFSFTFKLPDRTHGFTGRSTNRRVSVFDGFSAVVSPLVCAAQLPVMLTALHNGETVEFGDLKVALTGLTSPHWRKKNDHLAWRDVTSVKVFDGRLIISSRNHTTSWYSGRAAYVPNLDALLEILKIVVNAL
jgi:hypothetical protein